jgi:hypothetical protein
MIGDPALAEEDRRRLTLPHLRPMPGTTTPPHPIPATLPARGERRSADFGDQPLDMERCYPSFGQTATLTEVSFTRLFPNTFQESPKGKFDNNAQIRSENRKIGPDLSDALKMLELSS